MFGWLKTRNKRPTSAEPCLTLDDEGFSIVDGDVTSRWRWDAVRRIRAYKLDCFTYDTIRIEVDFAEGNSLMVDESLQGYSAWVTALDERFGLLDDWWGKVAFPPFATNLTVLWTHPDFAEPAQGEIKNGARAPVSFNHS